MRPQKILHIEDSEDDVVLFVRACDAAGLPVVSYSAADGRQAVAYLKGKGQFQDRRQHPLPDIIVLDLNMPIMGGIDFLKWFREESGLALPILIFTVSSNQEDKQRALAAGAAGYFVKPRDFETLVHLTESFRKFSDGPDKNKEPT